MKAPRNPTARLREEVEEEEAEEAGEVGEAGEAGEAEEAEEEERKARRFFRAGKHERRRTTRTTRRMTRFRWLRRREGWRETAAGRAVERRRRMDVRRARGRRRAGPEESVGRRCGVNGVGCRIHAGSVGD